MIGQIVKTGQQFLEIKMVAVAIIKFGRIDLFIFILYWTLSLSLSYTQNFVILYACSVLFY